MTATVTEATRAPLHDFVIHVPGEGIVHRTASTSRRAMDLAGVERNPKSTEKPYAHRGTGRCGICERAVAETTKAVSA